MVAVVALVEIAEGIVTVVAVVALVEIAEGIVTVVAAVTPLTQSASMTQ